MRHHLLNKSRQKFIFFTAFTFIFCVIHICHCYIFYLLTVIDLPTLSVKIKQSVINMSQCESIFVYCYIIY